MTKDEKFTEEWWNQLTKDKLELAGNFSPTALVASEMAIRAIVVAALEAVNEGEK